MYYINSDYMQKWHGLTIIVSYKMPKWH